MEMDGRNEQTEMSEVRIPISSSHGITGSLKRDMEDNLESVLGEDDLKIDMEDELIKIDMEDDLESVLREDDLKIEDMEDELIKIDMEDDLESVPVGASRAWKPMVPNREKDEHATQQLGAVMKLKLRSLSDASEDRCIYRVPKHMRDTNEAAYVPRLVSLGPFHHGNKNLKAMEEHKLRCFKKFIDEHVLDLDALISLMKGHEEKTRKFYADRIELSSDQFVQVILVDAIFVINFLLESNSSALAIHVGSTYDKKFFGSVVSRDMMLLENQLPLFILVEILDFATSTIGTGKTEKLYVTKLSNFLFECHVKEEVSVTKPSNCLFNCFMKEEGTDHKSDMTDLNSHNNATHFVDLQRLLYMPVEERREPKNKGKFKEIKSISKLHEAGVRFRVASGKKLFHIEFKDGVLEIPGILVSDPTEAIFRNLLAYDQCHYGPSPIGDYFVLMGMLIDTADDVDLLVKNKILQNDLPTAQEVSKVFNSLEMEVFYEAESFYYSHLCEQLNAFCDIPWHKWMATLKQNYLDTPWKVISLIAAFILLVLTMIQTVYSVISP